MVKRLVPIGLVAAVALGCSAGASTTPVPSATQTVAPSATPTPTAASGPSLTAVSARVTYDGKTCRYTGPTVIPFPASMTLEAVPTDEQYHIGIVAVRTGTTEAEINDPSPSLGADGLPSFVYPESAWSIVGTHTLAYQTDSGNPMAVGGATPKYDTFMVLCLPGWPATPTGGYTILHLVPVGS